MPLLEVHEKCLVIEQPMQQTSLRNFPAETSSDQLPSPVGGRILTHPPRVCLQVYLHPSNLQAPPLLTCRLVGSFLYLSEPPFPYS
jgi:hypothetical protein